MQKSVDSGFYNYKAVDIVKYIAAVMVICIHCNPIVSNTYLDYFINQIVCRVAVPFFFISSAYFIRKGSDRSEKYLKNYLKKLSISYAAWSVLFIPIGLDWIHQNLTLPQNLLPFALLFGIVHVGTYYHLWYVPALIISVFITTKLLKKFSYPKVIVSALLFFLFGCLETYYGVLSDGWLKNFFDLIIQVFFTTRSGLLYALIFVVIGFYIYDHQEKLRPLLKYLSLLTVLSGLLVVIEGILLYNVVKLDMNFLVSLVPFGFFSFLRILSLQKTITFDTTRLRTLSKYYYFIHTICIVIIEEIGKALHIPVLRSGMFSFLSVVLLTHMLCLVVISIQKHSLKSTRLVISALIGMGITFMIASLIYRCKPDITVIKFELVPCLWVSASIAAYFLLVQIFCTFKTSVKTLA